MFIVPLLQYTKIGFFILYRKRLDFESKIGAGLGILFDRKCANAIYMYCVYRSYSHNVALDS